MIAEVAKYVAVTTLVFAAGFFTGKGEKETQIVEREGKERIVYKDRIVTVTKVIKPDGTITETTRTENRNRKEDKKTTETAETSKPTLSRYSLGLIGVSHLDTPFEVSPGVTAGMRTLGDVWADVGYVPAKGEVLVGIRLEFQ